MFGVVEIPSFLPLPMYLWSWGGHKERKIALGCICAAPHTAVSRGKVGNNCTHFDLVSRPRKLSRVIGAVVRDAGRRRLKRR